MIIIGLTGGIGSGKTTVAMMFAELGVPVYFADLEAKKIMNTSKEVRKKLIDAFGEETFKNGELNRGYLAKIVFKNKEQLLILNGIVHPEVESHFKTWVKNQQAQFIIQESALIFENEKQNYFDKIITVTAPLEDRLRRVKKRDSVTEEEIHDRIRNQIEEAFKVEYSDYVIRNMELNRTKSQVKVIFNQLLLLSKN